MVDISIHRVVTVRTEVVEWNRTGDGGGHYYSLDITFVDINGSEQTVTAYSRHDPQHVDNPFTTIDSRIAEVIGGDDG